MGRILVVGCVSFDTLHLKQSDRQETWNTIGGAGLYTALAAAYQGAEVILYAPRPEPVPDNLEIVEQKITWLGPHCSPDEMPTLEIVHHGGGQATLVGANWGAEKLLTPDCLPEIRDLEFDIVHIAALSAAEKQIEFERFFARANSPRVISAGTYARAISADNAGVKRLVENSNLFFMNQNEANLLYGPISESMVADVVTNNDRVIFITGGEDGVTVYSAEGTMVVPADSADELDPTGAGDTFCGATLAQIADGVGPVEAARASVALSARVIEHPGPQFLLKGVALVFLCVMSILFVAPTEAKAPDLGNAVGVPTFYLKDKQSATAGKIYAVKLNSGKVVLVTPLHLLGPSSGFKSQYTTAECKKQISKVEIRDLAGNARIGSVRGQLLSKGDLSRLESRDLRDDLLAMSPSADCKLKPIAMNKTATSKGTLIYLVGKESGRPGKQVEYYEGTVTEATPMFVSITLKEPLRMGALSGSPVVDQNGLLVGMVYGGQPEERLFYLNPGTSIYSRLNSELH